MTAYLTEAIAKGAAAAWMLDDTSGNALDAIGGHTATKTGTPTQGVTTIVPSEAFSCDFTNNAAHYFMAPAGAWMAASDFSGVIWVKADDLSSYRCLMSREDSDSSARQWSWYLTGGQMNMFTSGNRLGTATLSTGTTYCLGFSYNAATSTLKYFIGVGGTSSTDATLTSVTIPNGGTATPYDLFINVSRAASGGLNFPFDGKLGGALYLPGVVLTQADFDDLYQAGLTVIVPPGVPTTVAVDPHPTTADATWGDPATGDPVDYFEVRLNGGSATNVGTDNDYELTGLSPHATYDSPGFEVRAVNGGGSSAWVAVPFQTEFAPVETTYYEVTIDGGPPENVGLDLCDVFTGLEPGGTYVVCVRACNDICCSEYACIEVGTCPDAPTGLTYTATRTSISLCWEENPLYTYEVSIDGGDPVEATSCYDFTGLKAGTSYTVSVRACNATCCGEYTTLSVVTAAPFAWSPCPCGTRWMVEACDLKTGRVRTVLKPISMDFQTLLNGIGGGTLTLPTRGVALRDIWPDLTSIYISRLTDDGTVEGMFGGYVEAVDGRSTTNGGTVSVGIKPIEHYLFRRRLRALLSYTGAPQTTIAASLVNYVLTNGVPLVGVADESTTLRDRIYDPAARPKIGDLVTQLAQVANGPEWTMLHDRLDGGWSSRMFFQDRAGVDRDDILHSDVQGAQYGMRVDGLDHANSADAQSGALTGTFTDLGPYPEFDTAETFQNVTLQATLDQAAAGIVQLRGEPYATPSLGIVGPDPAPENLRLGDSAIFHIIQSAITFNGRARVGGITWKLAEGQPETRTLALVPLEPSSQTVLNQTIVDRCVSCR